MSTISANIDLIDSFGHLNHHLEKLFELYDDIKMDNLSLLKDNPKHILSTKIYSASVNEMADNAIFDFKTMSANESKIYYANPYKKTYIDCKYCDGIIKIFSMPNKIPLCFMEDIDRWKETNILCFTAFAYEDFFSMHHLTHPGLMSSCKEFLINEIKTSPKHASVQTAKFDISFVNQSLKNLFTFS